LGPQILFVLLERVRSGDIKLPLFLATNEGSLGEK
jgi:hypothetical protein